ncbi:hypothetical protein BGZ96_004765 [Linnemannia gamsii]|uniref:Cas12f1-like TNB domain-containing protein n=1 Tax=Linnemannia gamsii TaxID=64522 RepID=A0ABQ7JI17_9FUNG|nr:hypothetical protein BGZ96_004765 [Linnemannia gamsii]
MEGYAQTRWLDVHCKSFGSNTGKAAMTSVPGLKHKDRYKDVRPIMVGAYDGQRLAVMIAVCGFPGKIIRSIGSANAAEARSLEDIIVGMNEFYTSKKYPDCQGFVAQVNLQQCCCSRCEMYYHRDVMAAEDMCEIVKGYLVKHERPRYLQPVTEEGRYSWDTKSTTGVGANTASVITSASTSSKICKRASFVSSEPSGHSDKMTKEGLLHPMVAEQSETRLKIVKKSNNISKKRPR